MFKLLISTFFNFLNRHALATAKGFIYCVHVDLNSELNINTHSVSQSQNDRVKHILRNLIKYNSVTRSDLRQPSIITSIYFFFLLYTSIIIIFITDVDVKIRSIENKIYIFFYGLTIKLIINIWTVVNIYNYFNISITKISNVYWYSRIIQLALRKKISRLLIIKNLNYKPKTS